MKNKYKAHPVYFSHSLGRSLSIDEVEIYESRHILLSDSAKLGTVIKFDSQLEFKVFQVLNSSSLVSSIIPHHQVKLIPKNTSHVFPGGKTWKVDFLVKGQHKEPLFLVEAKGIIQRDFPFILNLLEQNRPELFNKLWIVFNDKVPTSKLVVKNLRKNRTPKLVTLREFKNQFS
ncbi:MAG: hypothetical protein QNJ60_16485 [Xenococcaceae cyanobacterium MO_188.B19]|nr:hypothetical protein [Xenococcaceae cyanobacterium MO_188.B19]